MAFKKTLLAACAALTLVAAAAQAAPPWVPPGNDPGGYYSNQDLNGYYDRDGRYQRIRGLGRDRDRMPIPNSYAPPGNDPGGYYSDADRDGYYDRDGRFRRVRFARGGGYGPPPPPPPPQTAYGPPPPPPPAPARDCRRDNRTTGTVLGAIAGGLIGGFASHGNGLATVGGVVGGGLLGNVIGGDMDCEDQAQAYPIYVDSLNGDIGRPYEWHRGPNRGTFTSTREFRRRGQVCREFTTTTWRGPRSQTRTGIACRDVGERAGWRFD
jgi:surface antigen